MPDDVIERPRIQFDAAGRRLYTPGGLQLARFVLDRSPIAIIRGPIGSGKTAAACQRIWQHAIEQNRGPDGKRKSRWFVMRESYPRIETTTLATWLDWFDERTYGKLYTGTRPFLHEIRVGDIVLDVWFGAVDDERSEAQFKSLEPTGWYWNELQFQQMSPFFAAHGRVGRYPRLIEGGAKWSGSIADMNAAPENHWVPMMMGEVALPDDLPEDDRMAYQRPKGLAYFVQPPAMFEEKDQTGRTVGWRINPQAENLAWLADPGAVPPETTPGENYYRRALAGHTIRWQRANIGNKIIPLVEGDAVFPNFDDEVHVSRSPLEPVFGEDVALGLDFGRRPAILFAQTIGGQRQYQFEIVLENAGATKSAPKVKALLAKYYPWVMPPGSKSMLRAWGDPKGQDQTQSDEQTAYDVYRANGILVRPAPVKQNSIRTRVETVEFQLDRMVNARPAVLVSPRCARLKMALAGGYHYPKERPSPTEDRKPVKDKFSDVADAMQYLELGEGAGLTMIGRGGDRRPKPVDTRPQRRSYRRIA